MIQQYSSNAATCRGGLMLIVLIIILCLIVFAISQIAKAVGKGELTLLEVSVGIGPAIILAAIALFLATT